MRRDWLLLLSIASVFVGSNLLAGEGIDDVMKLAKAGLSQDVLMAFVDACTAPLDPTADEIKALRDAGVSPTVIVAMIDHGKPPSTGAQQAQPASETSSSQSTNPPQENGDESTTNATYQPPPDSAGNSNSPITTTALAPPQEDANISYFYETLAPHGSWHQSSNGYVWRPNVVSSQPDWRPYANDGHWVWTDAGWYWESGYPWGWAAFHYGRWHSDSELGWVWSPDTTWAPAWVSWRHSDSYYGWAPLPPEARYESGVGFSFHDKHVDVNLDFGLNERDYAFVPSDRFLDLNLGVAVVSRSNAESVYRQTTVVNNTYVFTGNQIVNNGVPFTQVEQRTHRRLDTVRIADAHFAAGTAIRGEVHSRNSIVAFRPAFSYAAPRDPAVAIARSAYVKRDVIYTHITVDQDRASERRLSSELSRRDGGAAVRTKERVETPVSPVSRNENRHDSATERRADSELAQREKTTLTEKHDRALPQTALHTDSHPRDETPTRERPAEPVKKAHDEAELKHSDRNDRTDREDPHAKKKNGHND